MPKRTRAGRRRTTTGARKRGVVYLFLRQVAGANHPNYCVHQRRSHTCIHTPERLSLRLDGHIRHTRAKSGAANGFARFELQLISHFVSCAALRRSFRAARLRSARARPLERLATRRAASSLEKTDVRARRGAAKLTFLKIADPATTIGLRPGPRLVRGRGREPGLGVLRHPLQVDVVRRHAGQLSVSALSATYLGGRVTSRSPFLPVPILPTRPPSLSRPLFPIPSPPTRSSPNVN